MLFYSLFVSQVFTSDHFEYVEYTLNNQTDREKLELRKDGYNLLLFF